MLFSNVIDLKNYEDNFDPPKNSNHPTYFLQDILALEVLQILQLDGL